MLTQARLQELIEYDPDTGEFLWRVNFRKGHQGEPVGHHHDGYTRVKLEGARYYLHQLAFLYMTGELPPTGIEVDHKNLQRSDNRWDNLRLATKAQQRQNQRLMRTNTSGLKGASFSARDKLWRSTIRFGDRQISLGYYQTAEEAHKAYVNAAQVYFGEFANAGGAS